MAVCVKCNNEFWEHLFLSILFNLSNLVSFRKKIIGDETLTEKLKNKMERIYEDDAVVSISRPKNDETPSANGAIVSIEAIVKGDSVLTV